MSGESTSGDFEEPSRERPDGSETEIGWASLALIFGAACLVRGLFVFELSQAPFFSFLLGDSRGYHLWAESLAAGDWLGAEVFYQAPFYPYLVGVLYSVFGVDAFVVKIGQVLLEAFSCVLLAGAGARLFASARVGVFAGALASVYAPAIFFVALVQKPTLGFFFVSLVLDLLSRIERRGHRSWLLVSLGLVLGLLALTRENALIFIPIVAVWLVAKVRRSPSRAIASAITLLLLGASLPLGVVGLRNYVVGGEFSLTTSQFGTNFFIGNNANAEGFYIPLRLYRGNVSFERDDATEMAEEAAGRTLSPQEVSRFWSAQALDYIETEPLDWLALMFRKAVLVWNRVEISDTEDIAVFRHFSWTLDVLDRVFHFGVIVPLAAAGVWLTRRRWRELWILHAMMVTYAASLTIFFLFARYRVPLVPITLLFAAVGIEEIGALVRRRDRKELWTVGCLIAVVALVVHLPLVDTKKQMAATYKNFGGELLERQSYSTAVEFFERSLEFRPENVESVLGIAQSVAYLGRFPESRGHFERVLGLAPSHPLALLGLGQVQLRQGEISLGIRTLERAIEADSTDHRAYFALGMRYALSNDLESAIDRLRQAAEREGSPFIARLELAKALYQSGDSDGARAEASWLVKRSPADLGATLLLARIWEETGETDRARSLAERALGQDPQNVAAQSLLARIDHVLVMEAAADARSDDAEARLELSRLYGRAKRWADAERRLREALALSPSSSVMHTELGFVLDKLGKRAEAILAFQAAAELDPANPNPHFHLGRIAARKSRDASARIHYVRALEIAPNHVPSRAGLEKLEARVSGGSGTAR